MKKPKCDCGADAIGSFVHTENCDVAQFERMEALSLKIKAKSRLIENEKLDKCYLVYDSQRVLIKTTKSGNS